MSVLENLDLDRLGPARLWRSLDAPAREEAAEAMFRSDDDDIRTEAALALAQQLRFRPQFVHRLPVAKRVTYLARQVRPDDNLAGSLLLALHLGSRRPMLATFLDGLGVPHRDGVIDEDHDLDPPARDDLAAAAADLDERFDRSRVDLYLATLYALDPDTWAELRPLLAERAGG